MGFSLGGHAPIFWLSSSWPIPTGALRSVKAVEGQASQAEVRPWHSLTRTVSDRFFCCYGRSLLSSLIVAVLGGTNSLSMHLCTRARLSGKAAHRGQLDHNHTTGPRSRARV